MLKTPNQLMKHMTPLKLSVKLQDEHQAQDLVDETKRTLIK